MRIFLRDNMYERNWGRKDKNKTEREKYKNTFNSNSPGSKNGLVDGPTGIRVRACVLVSPMQDHF